MNLDISRLRRSDQIIGGSAIALFIFLFFFKWYGGSASSPIGGSNFSSSLNGWHSFSNSRWIWLITIVVALGVAGLAAAQREVNSPLQPSVIVAGLGALSTVLILYRILHHPSGGASGSVGLTHFSYSYGIKIGIWLGLIAAAGITYGGYLAMKEEGTSLSNVREQASGAISGLSGAVTSGGSGGGSAEAAPPPPAPSAPSAGPPIPPPASPASSGEGPPAQ